MSVLNISQKEWRALKDSINKYSRKENIERLNGKTTTFNVPKQWLEYYEQLTHNSNQRDVKKRITYCIPKSREAERNKYVHEKRKEMYPSKAVAQAYLEEAIVLSETLFERQKQLELNELRKKDDKRQEDVHNEQIRVAVQMDREKEKRETEELQKKKMELRKIQQKQIADRSTIRDKEREKQKEEDKDKGILIRCEKEEEMFHRKQKNYIDKKKLNEEHSQIKQGRRALKEHIKEQDKTNYLLDNIYWDAKDVLHRLIMNKQQEIQNKLFQRREAAISKLEQMVKEKIQDKSELTTAPICGLRKMNLNRVKSSEDCKSCAYEIQHCEKREKRDRCKIKHQQKQNGFAIVRRIRTASEIEKTKSCTDHVQHQREVAKTQDQKYKVHDMYDEEKWRNQDKIFFNMAEEVELYLNKIKRPTFPIQKAIEKYKKENHIKNNRKV